MRMWSYWITKSDPPIILQVVKTNVGSNKLVRVKQVYGWLEYPYASLYPGSLKKFHTPILKRDIELVLLDRLT